MSVRLDHMHPKEVPFSFETQAPADVGAHGLVDAFHVVAVLAVIFIAAVAARPAPLDLRKATEDIPPTGSSS